MQVFQLKLCRFKWGSSCSDVSCASSCASSCRARHVLIPSCASRPCSQLELCRLRCVGSGGARSITFSSKGVKADLGLVMFSIWCWGRSCSFLSFARLVWARHVLTKPHGLLKGLSCLHPKLCWLRRRALSCSHPILWPAIFLS
jgi:hypothetical protein